MAGLKSDITASNSRPDVSPDSEPTHDEEQNGGQQMEGRSQSVADVINMEGLTLYEKKCLLVNREIDSMGMGKYQWCLWGLCGKS